MPYTSFAELVKAAVERAGSHKALGTELGMADGSRVGQWINGFPDSTHKRPAVISCVRLARWMDQPVLEVLRLAGYTDLADALEGQIPDTMPHRPALTNAVAHLKMLRHLLDSTLSAVEETRR